MKFVDERGKGNKLEDNQLILKYPSKKEVHKRELLILVNINKSVKM